ncbi:uncharacterized protein C1orf21 homolog [Polyodon spathula]|uniref:uncharacterized protein C1orf21 homolog n=1 Tax=Polyodon spathula TaxID=7913 RepID=UPI001B7ECBDA|nr:uncharacterized protein C1orf21 homolog [Polyodon spathula]
MGCTSAKHMSAVPSEEEEGGGGKAKAYQNGDAFGGELSSLNPRALGGFQSSTVSLFHERQTFKCSKNKMTVHMELGEGRGEERRGDEDGVTAQNQENLEKSASSNRSKSQKDGSGANSQRANIHTSESQQEFFRMLDEKIEKGPDYSSEEEKDII